MSHRRRVFISRLLDEWALIGAALDPLFMPALCPLSIAPLQTGALVYTHPQHLPGGGTSFISSKACSS